MSDDVEFRCFIGGLAWSTSDRALKEAFEKFGHLLEAKVVVDKFSGRSRGFGFVSFDEKRAMEEAIEAMNGIDLDGRTITVDKAQPNQGSGRDYDNDRPRDRGWDRGREFGGGRGSGGGGGECFKCGKTGHFARECPSDGAKGGGYGGGGRDDRYGGSHGGGGGSRGGGRGGGHYGTDRGGDRYGGRDRDNGGREEEVIDMAVTVLDPMIVEVLGDSDLAEGLRSSGCGSGWKVSAGVLANRQSNFL